MKWRVAALWAVFALLVAFGGRQFLYACGLNLGPLSRNYCLTPIDRRSAMAEAERGERLQRLIHTAEMTLAQKPLCPPPSLAPASHKVEEFNPDEHPSLARGASEGKVEVYLSWNTHDDLDLEISCPGGGRIGGQHGRPGSCGEGALDIDANRNLSQNVSDTPEEHAVWANLTPSGQMKVEAFLFRAANPGIHQKIPFELTFKLDDEQQRCFGEIELFPRSEGRRTSFGKTLSSTNPYLNWTPSRGMPQSCDWKIDEGYYCAPGECGKY